MKTTQYNLDQVYTNSKYDQHIFFQQQGLNAVICIIGDDGKITMVPGAFFAIHGAGRMVTVSDGDIDYIIANYSVPSNKRSTVGKSDLPNPLEVVRFIRPVQWDNDNLYGVTLVFNLDYNHRKIDVGISICNGDNFEKDEGVRRARSGNMSITGLDMPDDIFNCTCKDGLVTWLIERSVDENEENQDVNYNIAWKSIEMMIDIYAASL